MDYLDGSIYHFRDNVTGLEVDGILEFSGGDYAAIEIKLGFNKVEEANPFCNFVFNYTLFFWMSMFLIIIINLV